MGFDLKKFRKSDLKPRTDKVKLSEMKAWFGEDEPVFIVRGLVGEEFYHVKEAVEKRRDIQAIAAQLFSGKGEAIASAVQEFYGSAPDEYVKLIEAIKIGVTEPELDHSDAMKLVKNFPVQSNEIFKKIMLLTGVGSELGESKGCGEIPASDTTSTSATCGENASSS